MKGAFSPTTTQINSSTLKHLRGGWHLIVANISVVKGDMVSNARKYINGTCVEAFPELGGFQRLLVTHSV